MTVATFPLFLFTKHTSNESYNVLTLRKLIVGYIVRLKEAAILINNTELIKKKGTQRYCHYQSQSFINNIFFCAMKTFVYSCIEPALVIKSMNMNSFALSVLVLNLVLVWVFHCRFVLLKAGGYRLFWYIRRFIRVVCSHSYWSLALLEMGWLNWRDHDLTKNLYWVILECIFPDWVSRSLRKWKSKNDKALVNLSTSGQRYRQSTEFPLMISDKFSCKPLIVMQLQSK